GSSAVLRTDPQDDGFPARAAGEARCRYSDAGPADAAQADWLSAARESGPRRPRGRCRAEADGHAEREDRDDPSAAEAAVRRSGRARRSGWARWARRPWPEPQSPGPVPAHAKAAR